MRILMTEATSLSARQTLYALDHANRNGRSTPIVVDAIDPAPLSQCRFSTLVRSWSRCPHYAKHPREFLDDLRERLRSGRYDVLLPTHEQTILLCRHQASLHEHVGLALPEPAAVDRMQNKTSFMAFLQSIGVGHPQSRPVRSIDDLMSQTEFPIYLKLAHSTAGGGVHRIETIGQLRSLAMKLSGEHETIDAIAQAPGRGDLSTVKAVFDHGRPVAIAMYQARQTGLGGMSTARTSADHPAMFDAITTIGAALDWHGAMFLDYFHDAAKKRVEVIEGNPRIGETFNPTLAGVNLAHALVRISAGERLPTFDAKRPGRVGVQTHSFYMIAISDAHAGCGRGKLIRTWLNWCRGRGIFAGGQDDLTRPRDDWMSLLPLVWILGQLLLWPSLAKRLVRRTIRDYSLPADAMERLTKSDSIDADKRDTIPKARQD